MKDKYTAEELRIWQEIFILMVNQTYPFDGAIERPDRFIQARRERDEGRLGGPYR